ncbi:hypothetical protein [Alteromonas macleodii]|uniref:hypothetical protein n=1 Tax=Alteromonas macleodii TaxID=28108 RepID=UPI00066B34D9|nr:hypothetical protein [Alteromonas macleodii]NKX21442.1 hypothetical protein [Alteromonadaceae bacterium A_SAG2]CAI3954176.1 hypothetical protein MIT1002_01892 [Alteromonas macleodii]VTP52394.1 hypothetical protein MIT1002_01892 [Alteromonas macleodii]
MTPTKISVLSSIFLVIASVATSLIGLNQPLLSLNENQIFYLYSTSAQVLAGIYGLTLTGFIFFRNELSREEFEDDTLTVAVESLKERYFNILLFVTALSIFTLVISNLVISSESSEHTMFNTILMNTAQSAFFINLLVIAYFIFDVIAPKRIEKESKVIQQKVDPTPEAENKGSLESFLTNYNQLEYILQKYGQAYQSELEGKSRSRRRISNVRLAEFILRAERIDQGLFGEIKSLISLRNSIIHGAEPVVSKHMVEVSENILQELASALNVKI